jgi:Raf kinase inhibitor-like YbhB/YbcL family protein
MRAPATAAALVVIGALGMTSGSLAGQVATAVPRSGVLAIQQLKTAASPAIQVGSSAFTPDAAIPEVHSDYGQKVSPPLQWSGVPPATKSLVIVMEDPDAQEPNPFVHWLVYNVAPTIQKLPEGLPSAPRLKDFEGALQGRTSKGNVGYFGPRPPKLDPPHHYHFEVFALDTMLTLDPSVPRDVLLTAMTGHVLAAGELVGTFKAPADAK